MSLSIIGLGHAFKKQYKAIKLSNKFKTIILCDNKKIRFNVIKDYHRLNTKNILISTSPNNHLQILKDFNNKTIILEKPLVKNLNELNELKNNLEINNIFSSLHFSYGKEIDYFINELKIKEKPKKIYCYISDKYIRNNHIKKKQLGLCGAYLDETINPLSAICRIFGYNVKFINVKKKKYPDDYYDYYALSKFEVNDIPIEIEVNWNNNHNDKYIKLIYKDKTIILDSMKQQVILNNKLLYKAHGDRMTNHYIGVFNDFTNNINNIRNSIKMHEELLKGIENEN